MRVFLSSTYEDLVLHREKAAHAIERLGQQGVRMKVFGARPLEPTQACFEEIEASEALVGIYAHRYGYIPSGSAKSITEQEFDCAHEKAKPIFCFMVEEDYPWLPRYVEGEPARAKLHEFKQRVRNITTIDSFTTPEDLAYKVSSSLGRFLLTRKIREELERIPQGEKVSTEHGRSQVARRGARLQAIIRDARILLVNDVPAEMFHVMQIIRGLDLEVEVATTSEDALGMLTNHPYDVVISDMRRGTIEDEGIRFLSRMRANNLRHPVIFTVGRYEPGRGTPAHAFGITNRIDELLNLLFDALERIRG